MFGGALVLVAVFGYDDPLLLLLVVGLLRVVGLGGHSGVGGDYRLGLGLLGGY